MRDVDAEAPDVGSAAARARAPSASASSCLCVASRRRAQEPPAPQAVLRGAAAGRHRQARRSRLRDAHDAARGTVRRAPAPQAVPALLQAVAEHADGYVRFRALVLLTGFNDPRTTDAMRESLTSPNDRLREVAYGFFEHNPGSRRCCRRCSRRSTRSRRSSSGRRWSARSRRCGDRSDGARAGAASRDVDARRGLLPQRGDRGARRLQGARTRSTRSPRSRSSTARCRTTPCWRWARSATSARSRRWRRCSARRRGTRQPSIAAAICLLGVNCESHESYLIETLKFADTNPGYQELLRGAAAGLGALGVAGQRRGRRRAVRRRHSRRAIRRARRSRWRSATVALRNTPLMLPMLEKQPDPRRARSRCSREGFDMLEEDLEEERFFALVRRTYWAARRGLADARADADADRQAGVLTRSDVSQATVSGVDIDAGNETVRRIKSLARAHVHAGRAVGHRIVRRPVQLDPRRATASRCSSRAPTASAPS